MAIQIQLRRDTAANWTNNNPTLAEGELGSETDTDKFKIGDGATAWTSLAYSSGTGDVTAAANLTDETIVQGDGGAKGVKTSTATVAQIANNVAHVAGDGSDHADVANNNKKHLRFNIFNPSEVQGEDGEICLWPETDSAIVVDKITVTLDSATNEIVGDLKYADTFIGLANPAVINPFDTTSGVREDDSITSGNVAAGKCIYLSFDSAPHADITQACFDIEYHYT